MIPKSKNLGNMGEDMEVMQYDGLSVSKGKDCSTISKDTVTETLSVCLVCGKQDRSVEFILPDHYCSQSCADKHGADQLVQGENAALGARKAIKRRKVSKSSSWNSYDEEFKVYGAEQRKLNKAFRAKSFTWRKYLSEESLRAAPDSCFPKEPPVTFINSFKVGMKMEGIDPLHPSKYCVLSVVEIKGHRLRLHFDGYAECHDFWTYAYSDEIFPVGWCKNMGKELQIPKGVAKEAFSWEQYLLLSKSPAAPHSLFTVCSKEFVAKKPAFGIGDKLEAVDIKNKNTYICVATVADTYADKLLVHFDGWEDNYDYWCYYNSAHIHHVGWCQENLKTLSAPNGYVDPSIFTWDSYLEETKSKAAPLDGFAPVEIHEFEVGMALEAVDKRNPSLARAAEILKVTDKELCIHFCGWDNKYDYWEDASSPELHPVGWCQRTSHYLQPPLTPLEIVNYSGPCPTLGCYGYGHVKGAKFFGHHSLVGCPYSHINLNKDNQIPNRLSPSKAEVGNICSSPVSPTATKLRIPLVETNNNDVDFALDSSEMSTAPKRKRGSSIRGGRTKGYRKESMEMTQFVDEDFKSEMVDASSHHRNSPPSTSAMPQPPARLSAQAMLQNEIHNSVFLPTTHSQKPNSLPICWDRHIKLLPGIAHIPYSTIPSWSAERVVDFVKTIVPNLSPSQTRAFIEQKIDGEAFLLLSQSDITSILNLKLGPAIKIYNSVLVIKKAIQKL